MLGPYRVVELAGYGTALCGQMLGDLGADVVVVEPPRGAPLRRQPPYYGDAPHPDRSLSWWATNRNKRGVTLDLETEQGRRLLRDLVRGADFVLDGLPPGKLDALGLGYAQLSADDPRLLMVSTSPFGQDGPKADFSSVDLIVMAASMLLYATGDGDLPPLHLSSPQAAMHAGAETAATVLIAHYGRERSGRGQHLDVSAQAALTMATQSAVLAPAWEAPGAYVSRAAGGLKVGPIVVRLLFPCKDGHVSCTFLFGSAIGPMSRRLMQVIHERGFCDASLAEKDFVNYQQLLMTFKEPITELFRAYAAIDAFFKTQTKAELFALAQERNLLIAPCSTLEDLVHSPQLDSRSYWVAVEHPELGRSFRYPGPFAKLSETPLTYRQRAPLLGEHNAEVFGSLGLTAGDLVALSGQAVL